jgi:hypothetical protein
MFIVVQSNNIDDGVSFATNIITYYCKEGRACNCILPITEFEDDLKKRFDVKTIPSIILHARHLDFYLYQEEVRKKLAVHDVVICVNYYSFQPGDLRMRQNDLRPDILFGVLGNHYNFNHSLREFCHYNDLDMVKIVHPGGDDLKIQLMTVELKKNVVDYGVV